MRRRCTKLLGICLITGLGLQGIQSHQAFAEHRSSVKTTHRKLVKHTRKKATPYRIRRHKAYQNPQNEAYNTDNSQSESGTASWYGGRHNRLRTASGSRFNSTQLTAAHPSLPMGTKVLVRSEDTGNAVVVTINDRGPYSGNRIIDLSKAAAAKIGMVRRGTAHVTITPITQNIEVAEAPE
ncbi:septal ring lytic transglycosylase RlpA family protein [Commensalibacter oyaizuii]|uniref:Endolytic peptidoglycan transglycosylase RlpA n=1 Tax=Commensalibacter oyaizuii TaxID=3043873 RepID=A0ABT6Q449_9PROT|nr:septal ring lytic transglycosylase RlpA family protein [Commensalibacter sp. TBRC 16381]MDI2091346.1 septal ring lytic transglycosylase RlpA family protein [Commensalibacter sp. TBRC 16381]